MGATMKASIESLHATLGLLVGGQIRLATETDEIAGVRPQFIVEPANEAEVAAVLAFADREGLKVLVRGGGTQSGLGFPPTGGDIILSTTWLNQVVEHVPHDMTVTVQAGLPLDNLQTILSQQRQWLALDPILEAEATIGGLIATNVSGSRRLRYGGVRDQIIGIRVVLPDGTIGKGGGKVVKNVAGYDLPKLFAGSLGTLGVIASATFRLYPLPTASRTVVLTTSEPFFLWDLALRTLSSTLVPTIMDILGSNDQERPYTMAVRFEMGQEAAEAQAATLVELAANVSARLGKTAKILHGEAEEQFWSCAKAHFAVWGNTGAALTLKTSVLPTEMVSWVDSLHHTAQEGHLSTMWRAHAGHGLIFTQLAGADETTVASAVEALRLSAQYLQGSLAVLDGPATLTQQLDVWGTTPALDVMHRLKSRFDPHATLNPGRFVGRI
jgi:glycolate oxidase FAD binding subunit